MRWLPALILSLGTWLTSLAQEATPLAEPPSETVTAVAQPEVRRPARSRRVDAKVLAVAKVLPAVVNVSTERIVTSPHQSSRGNDPFSELFDEYFQENRQEPRTSNSLGSGVIIDAHGLVLTNYHVILRASRIIVTLADGRNFDATPVAADESNDLALLRIDSLPEDQTLAAIDFALPGDLYLAETVVTVGNPFGLGHSVASGVLSAVGRHAYLDGQLLHDDILQTDAAINPGNSGGPLVNLDGQLIGINLAIRADAQGIGFAIPVKRLESVLANWLLPNHFGQQQLGLIPATAVDAEGQPYVSVAGLVEGSPAAAGLETGDVITAIDGVPVRQAIDVSRRLWRLQAEEAIVFTLADGNEVTITTVKRWPISWMSSSIFSVAIGSSAEQGSSISRTSGSVASARAMHSRCC